jgi:hypothetical protein
VRFEVGSVRSEIGEDTFTEGVGQSIAIPSSVGVIDDGGVHECKTLETVTVERQNISLQKRESQMTELCENEISRNTMRDRVIVYRRCFRIVRPTRSSICCFGFGYMVSLLHAQFHPDGNGLFY